jgi:hypothetical protein
VPKIQWENLPREKWAHLRDRAKERKVSMEDLFELANCKSQDPDVADGDWCKDFGTFKLWDGPVFRTRFDVGRPAKGQRL